MVLFIVGFCFAVLGTTILNAISDIIATWAEVVKANLSYQIMQYNNAIEDLKNASPTILNSNAIGFQGNFDEEKDELDDD